ncbi:hypothetical protein [Shewanella sp. Isolate11]|uniref:hypothetical protein n=1 Tax=Shewanella sp. Isolate11 TaxID=2908530 RepID=UPI001EFC3BBB|nr:hypothetical protein [Shewanella sp. Isolate11]MCG9697109.1 hypothetical protein [Shewanella sp. Isolate11]
MAIVFFYPTINKKLGGAQRLIITLAKCFNDRNIDIKIIDHRTGYCSSFISDLENVEFLNYSTEAELKKLLHKLSINDTLIVFNTMYEKIRYYNGINCKLLFWDLLHSSMRGLFSTRLGDIPYISHKDRATLFKRLCESNALITLDTEGKKWIRNNCNESIPLIPLPITKPNPINLDDSIIRNAVTYVGRATFWKVTPIAKVMEDMYYNDVLLSFNIYTDDRIAFESGLKKLLDERLYQHYKNNIRYYENYIMEDIYELSKNDLIHFGMASVAIEFAFQGFFTVNLDCSLDKFPSDYQYRYLFECGIEGSICQTLNYTNDFIYRDKGKKISEVYKDSVDTVTRSKIIYMSKKYAEKHHSVDSIVDSLIYYSNHTSLNSQHYFQFLEGLTSIKLLNLKDWMFKNKSFF